MRIFQPTKTPFVPRTRLINLVDILFILLIFFVATTTFRVASQPPTGVRLSLPEAKTAEAVGRSRRAQVRLTVDAGGTIYLDGTAIAGDQLEALLRTARQENPDVVIELSADRNARYGVIVGIVDAARAAGVENITAFTEKSVR
jgi:biopolymer transport protein ExbD